MVSSFVATLALKQGQKGGCLCFGEHAKPCSFFVRPSGSVRVVLQAVLLTMLSRVPYHVTITTPPLLPRFTGA